MSLKVKTMSEWQAEGKSPDILFWIGSAGSFDERAKKITRSFIEILNTANVDFGVLGTEESDSGDVAKRAGNEFLFQMQAMLNIEILNAYNIKRIVTTCPHDYNTIKNEYKSLGGKYEVLHHTEFISELINDSKISIDVNMQGVKATYHDPCYLGRANNVYEAPRQVIEKLDAELFEMKSCKEKGLCCGAGGAQMFKESEPGKKEVNIKRTEQALEINPDIIASGCPFCNTMLSDGLKNKEKQDSVKVLDIAELINQASQI